MIEKYDGRKFRAEMGLESISNFKGGYSQFLETVRNRFGEDQVQKAEKSWTRSINRRINLDGIDKVTAGFSDIYQEVAMRKVYQRAAENVEPIPERKKGWRDWVNENIGGEIVSIIDFTVVNAWKGLMDFFGGKRRRVNAF